MKKFLKDKIIYIILLIFTIISIEIFLIPYNVQLYIKIYVPVIICLSFIVAFITEYYSKEKYYKTIKSRMEDLQEKYLITELLPKSNYIETEMMEDIIKDMGKSMLENVNMYKYLQDRKSVV